MRTTKTEKIWAGLTCASVLLVVCVCGIARTLSRSEADQAGRDEDDMIAQGAAQRLQPGFNDGPVIPTV